MGVQGKGGREAKPGSRLVSELGRPQSLQVWRLSLWRGGSCPSLIYVPPCNPKNSNHQVAGLLMPLSLWHDTVHVAIGFIIALAQSRKDQGDNECLVSVCGFATHHHLDDLGETKRTMLGCCSVSVQVSGHLAAKFSHLNQT